ncbi:MAG: HEAT repeat domain-containing protein [Terrisporobacter sp.]|uniref:HEAT repeat domain-containing protein n=1 Tax=Terrisporobacter sp. TaxID=1965305 RepID=UPI002FC751B6
MKYMTVIYVLLSFFVYIIFCSVTYMIVTDIIEDKFNKKTNELTHSFGKEVLKQLSAVKLNNSVSKMDLDYIKEKLNKNEYVKVFNDVIIKFNENEENHLVTREYMIYFEEIILLKIKKVERKDDTIKSYMVFVLGEYRISNYEISEFLIRSLKTKSMYLRVASLKTVAKIGNLNTLLNAIKYLSKEDKYIHNKVFVDILSQFSGDKVLLNTSFMECFDELKEDFQKVIVENYTKNKVTYVKDQMLRLLKDSNTKKETKISIIRYFGSIKSQFAKDEMIKLLNKGEWEYRVVCAYALKNYKDEETTNALIESISDKNWHVRYNSATTLLKFNESYIISKVLEKNDKYSRDILFYVMFDNNEISYEEYLEKSRKVEVV